MKTSLKTPCLLLDLARMEQNIRRVSEFVQSANKTLRPHAKTHKSAAIANLQCDISPCTVGICATKLSEAEALVQAGYRGPSLLLTSPIVDARRATDFARLFDLMSTQKQLLQSVVHSERTAKVLNDAIESGSRVEVLIEIECGQERTGCKSIASLMELAALIVESMPRLHLRGVQCYCGHLQHVKSGAERRRLYLSSMQAGVEAFQRLQALYGTDMITTLTGGGSGTLEFDCSDELAITEMQPGSYVVGDVEYAEIDCWTTNELEISTNPPLLLLTRVLNVFHSHLVVDAGEKAMYSSGPGARVLNDAHCSYEHLGDEHGRISPLPTSRVYSEGDVLALIVSHCDPTIALHDYFYTDTMDETKKIRIDARGCFY